MVEHGNKYGSDLVLHKSRLFNHCDRKYLHPYFQQNQVAGSKLGVLSVQNIAKYLCFQIISKMQGRVVVFTKHILSVINSFGKKAKVLSHH